VVVKNIPFLLTDTVGFIRKLPTQLVESFKSTLDEVREADLLLHVVDISHSNFEDHIESVNSIIEEISTKEEKGKPTIMVFNKIDQFSHKEIDDDDLTTERTKEHYSLEEWKKTWYAKMNQKCVFISALNKENLEEFKSLVFDEVKKIHITRFPYNDFLYQEYHEEG
jgi:GTP-binding protein HflX